MRTRKTIVVTLLLLGVSALSGGCIDGFYAGVQGGVEDSISGIISTLVDAAISPLLPAE